MAGPGSAAALDLLLLAVCWATVGEALAWDAPLTGCSDLLSADCEGAGKTGRGLAQETCADRTVGYTYQRADGNRIACGRGVMDSGSEPVEINVGGFPEWLVGVPSGDGATIWGVVLGDGRTMGFRVSTEGDVSRVMLEPTEVAEGKPVVLVGGGGGEPQFLTTQVGAKFTHPTPLASGVVSVQSRFDGESLAFAGDGSNQGFLKVPLHDARILTDGEDMGERFMALVQPTVKYPHGVLGDSTEAEGISLFSQEQGGTFTEALFIPAPGEDVFEGLFPVWADVDDDGELEIVATLANSTHGARVAVYSEEGEVLGESEPVGAFRWRNVGPVGPFGPRGEIEVVDVLTPHLTGTVEFFQLDKEKKELVLVAEKSGYTSHVIDTRNLDLIAGGDFDGDGNLEVLLPDIDTREHLAAVRHIDGGAIEAWRVPLGAPLASNIATVSLSDSKQRVTLVVAAGNSDGIIKIWQ
ncbi:unnamed protein product [Ostreobium quekettii]|uniref:FG-GAP repeat protein n=1 Tax=Ostreobium quekettii TaxID=121088 RepID=A0A8S1J0P6_9CHLO|nr:unnamed protein product [Ostreobium quekettii]|eukprot:evm.model.scf_226EXC.8 EVM.evm.TU.scf_226EXC.8   scf_226EXC:50865-52821(-)